MYDIDTRKLSRLPILFLIYCKEKLWWWACISIRCRYYRSLLLLFLCHTHTNTHHTEILHTLNWRECALTTKESLPSNTPNWWSTMMCLCEMILPVYANDVCDDREMCLCLCYFTLTSYAKLNVYLFSYRLISLKYRIQSRETHSVGSNWTWIAINLRWSSNWGNGFHFTT